MILHLAEDGIFIDYAIDQFETIAPGHNKFLIHVPNQNNKLKHIKKSNKVITATWPSKDYLNHLGDLTQYNFVVIHCLNNYKVDIINRAHPKTKFLWIFWGHEIYSTISQEKEKCLQPVTKSIMCDLQMNQFIKRVLVDKCKSILRPIYYRFFNKYVHDEHYHRAALKCVDCCATFMQEDYKVAKRYMSKKIEWQWFSYFSMEPLLGPLFDKKCNGHNILLGNSSTAENNHLEALAILSKLQLNAREVITPLSYGIDGYRDRVVQLGHQCFGDHFKPLILFMDIEAYNAKLQSCGIVVMNHYRQQAVGNILTTLWLGAKLYLNECNPVYQYLHKLGIILFSIEKELVPDNPSVLTLMSDSEINHNRKILLQEFSRENLLLKTKALIERLSANSTL